MSAPTPDPAAAPQLRRPPAITVCPDGPYLVRGDVELNEADGTAIARPAGTIALCRCGKSKRTPFCDGTHKLRAAGRQGRGASAEGGVTSSPTATDEAASGVR